MMPKTGNIDTVTYPIRILHSMILTVIHQRLQFISTWHRAPTNGNHIVLYWIKYLSNHFNYMNHLTSYSQIPIRASRRIGKYGILLLLENFVTTCCCCLQELLRKFARKYKLVKTILNSDTICWSYRNSYFGIIYS